MTNKTSFLLSFLCFFSITLFAQNQTDNPFSILGIGEMTALPHGQYGAVGNASAIFIDSMSMNNENPASYSFLSKGYPLFGGGFSGVNTVSSSNGSKTTRYFVNFSNFGLAVPMKYGLGASFGAKPYARKGYDFVYYDVLGTDSVKQTYKGVGGQQVIYIGFSWMPIRKQFLKLGFGINGDYIFGRSRDSRFSQFNQSPTQNAGAAAIKTNYISDINVTLGMYGTAFLGKSLFKRTNVIGFGFTYSPSKALKLRQQNGQFYSVSNQLYIADALNENTYDTISLINSAGTYTAASDLKIGLSYSHFFESKAKPCVRSFVQLNQLQLSNVEISLDGVSSKPFSLDQSQLSFGLEYKPKTNTEYKELKFEYLKRMTYRAGFYHTKLPYAYNNKQYTETGITAGLALPIGSSTSRSSFNISMQYANRGAGTGSIQQKIVSFGIGVVVAPSAADRWFRKYKLD